MNKKAVIEDSEIKAVVEEVEVGDIVDEVEVEDSEDPEEVVVSIGEEPPPPESQHQDHRSFAKMRVENREHKQRIRELESKLQVQPTENKPVSIGIKPKLEDHDYDADKYEEALTGWFERKRQADDVNAAQEAEVMNQQKAFQAQLDGYGKAKAELRVKDYEDAEAVVVELFSAAQQGMIVDGAENSALVVYALGKNPKKAKELADIKNHVKFAFAVAKLEKDLKVTNRRQAPAPERSISGTGRSSGAVDSTLERLREDAARTGNMTKVIQYKAQKRTASK